MSLASNSFPKHEFKNDSINSVDATSDLNDSISGIVSTKKPEQTKSESVKDEVKEKPSKFVAGKGQKMAMKRLDKLKGNNENTIIMMMTILLFKKKILNYCQF